MSDSTLVTPGLRASAREALAEHVERQNWSALTPSRARVLEAFLKLATTQGFDAVTMRMIAKAIDIKAPTLYAHFPDGKDEIVAESLRWHFHRFASALLDVVAEDQGADEFWDAMVRLHFSRQTTLPESNLWDLLVEIDRMAAIFSPELRQEVERWLQLHENMYRAAAADLGANNPGRAARVVSAIIEASTRWYDGGAPLESEADRAVAISRLLLFGA